MPQVRSRNARPRPADARIDFADIYRAHAAAVARWVAHLGGPRVEVEDETADMIISGDHADGSLGTNGFYKVHFTKDP
jgi:hypothetical protein